MKLIEMNRETKGVALITLNRSEAANALSKTLLLELNEAIAELQNDSQLRAVIVTGAGEKAFCAGADLKERAGMEEAEVKETVKLIGSTITKLANFPVPVIAAINGAAFGGGLELALACDLRLASETAKMGLTETALGIIPGAGGTQRLPRIIGVAAAKELIYTARRIDAHTANSLGIVSRVVAQGELIEEAKKLAQEIAENAPLSLRAAKAAINEGLDVSLEAGLAIEKIQYNTTIRSNDRLEGLAAFKEKRKPVFTGN
ncbi:enoyl-CoA hydratase [Peribacillus asahii]|uniref:enoyl-CoA hydratase n=1 Tax=Peribacillus asahii TaxID=228899 RepID=UPI00207A6883|nr:enoyl-CoA hydratase [Peribacillus asahii]USK71941.1 enoyl-CoA hydratase [Peribacillus asahii]